MPTVTASLAALAPAAPVVPGVRGARAGRRREVWGTTWRLLVSVLLGGVLFVAMAVVPPRPAGWSVAIDVVLGLVVIGLLPWRRRWPFPVAIVAAVASGFSALGVGAVGIIVISHATHRRWRQLLVVAAVWVAAGAVQGSTPPASTVVSMGFTALGDLLIFALCVAVGAYIGGRRELVASLRAQVEAANRERLGLEDRARLTERSRIAREMHDVLAHRISLVAMHAGALAYRTDLTREETAEAATVVRDNAHRALTELRQVLGVLRDPEGGLEPDRPQPTLCDLLELLAEFRATGARLEVEDGVGERAVELPAPVGRNAYRIVQEALTNVRKHAPGRPAVLRLTGAPGDRLVIEISNPLPVTDPVDGVRDAASAVPGAGMGLTGLVERARLAGGELTYGHRPGHLFVVRAWLPWQS